MRAIFAADLESGDLASNPTQIDSIMFQNKILFSLHRNEIPRAQTCKPIHWNYVNSNLVEIHQSDFSRLLSASFQCTQWRPFIRSHWANACDWLNFRRKILLRTQTQPTKNRQTLLPDHCPYSMDFTSYSSWSKQRTAIKCAVALHSPYLYFL